MISFGQTTLHASMASLELSIEILPKLGLIILLKRFWVLCNEDRNVGNDTLEILRMPKSPKRMGSDNCDQERSVRGQFRISLKKFNMALSRDVKRSANCQRGQHLRKKRIIWYAIWALIFSSPGEVSWNFEDCSEINDGKVLLVQVPLVGEVNAHWCK